MRVRVQIAEPSPSFISVGSVPGLPLLRICDVRRRTCVASIAELRVLRQSSVAIRTLRRNQFFPRRRRCRVIDYFDARIFAKLFAVRLENIFPLISAPSDRVRVTLVVTVLLIRCFNCAVSNDVSLTHVSIMS